MNARTRTRIGVLRRKIAEARKERRNAEKAGQQQRALAEQGYSPR